MEKLEIPAPDEPRREDDTTLSLELWVGCSLILVLSFFGWFLWPGSDDEPDPYAHIEDEEQRAEKRDRDTFSEWVDDGTISDKDWRQKSDRAARVFEVGPRRAAELVCEQYRDDITEQQAVARALVRAVDRRFEDAPWSCLMELYLDDELADETNLHDAITSFWEDIQFADEHGGVMEATVSDFKKRKAVSDSERFDRWLRRCAIAVDYEAASRCRELMRMRSSDFEADLLEVLLTLIGDDEVTRGDLRLAAEALTEFSDRGQPDDWRIDETEALADYDVDFRLASLFFLCRLMNSPDEMVQRWAADGLGSLSGVGGRAADPDMQRRWRSTCRRAFGDPDNPHMDAPFLGVLVERGGQMKHDYGLESLIGSGLCPVDDERPYWYCGARRWTGGGDSIQDVLGYHFSRTSYVEWADDGAPAFVLPGSED